MKRDKEKEKERERVERAREREREKERLNNPNQFFLHTRKECCVIVLRAGDSALIGPGMTHAVYTQKDASTYFFEFVRPDGAGDRGAAFYAQHWVGPGEQQWNRLSADFGEASPSAFLVAGAQASGTGAVVVMEGRKIMTTEVLVGEQHNDGMAEGRRNKRRKCENGKEEEEYLGSDQQWLTGMAVGQLGSDLCVFINDYGMLTSVHDERKILSRINLTVINSLISPLVLSRIEDQIL
jgi:hypothetical protein